MAVKLVNFQMKTFDIFLIFVQKQRSWAHVRIDSLRRFYRVPTLYVLEQKLETNTLIYTYLIYTNLLYYSQFDKHNSTDFDLQEIDVRLSNSVS